jgi:RNA-directed DNA polymerase
LDKELERRGHRFARYADDFLVLVKSAKAAQRVMGSLTRFVEGRLKLVVNRAKTQAAPLKQCAFLGFQIGTRGRAVWTTGSNGNSLGLAAAICSPWVFPRTRCTWLREAARGIGG